MYIMFQGVMFTAVSQNSLLNCSLSWCPASLCAVAYLATIFTVSERFKSEDQLKQEVMGTKLLLSCVTDSLDRVEQLGVDLDLETQHPKLSLPFLGRTNGCKFLLSLNNLLVLTFLTSFSAFVGWFCVSTLCKNCKTCQR
ncbi:hypothetical protein KP509_34G051200 [Ceratopteris richardii]|nr:hypothetical protein KP509_34G051200 [Ceratopteris richardii]